VPSAQRVEFYALGTSDSDSGYVLELELLRLFLPCQLLVPKVAPRLCQNGNLRCLMHKEMDSLCIRHLRFLFQPSLLGAIIGTKSWHEGIAAILKMALWELREKVRETDQQ
jgi:hypothetical protein